MPIDEKDIIVKCDLVLVYIRPGIYGEVKEIRAPALPDTVSNRGHDTSSDTITSVDTTEGHNKSLEFAANTAPSEPSKTAASRRIHRQTNKAIVPTPTVPWRSPRKRKAMNYKAFVSGLDNAEHPGLTSPKKKKPRGNLRQPSRTRIAAQKKIQQARTQRLCSPPPPTQVTTANTPERVTPETATPTPTRIHTDTTNDPTNPDQEMNEAANTLLSLSGDADRTVDESMDAPKKPDTAIITGENTSRPPVAFEVNVIIDPNDNSLEINTGQIIRSAIKEEHVKPIKPAEERASEKPKRQGKTLLQPDTLA